MLKKIAIAALMFILPLGVMAQAKFAHLNSQEIITVMPEFTKAQADLDAMSKKYQEEMQRTQEEFNKRYQEFVAQADSLPKTIAERRQKELQDMQTRLEQFQQNAQQTFQMEQQKYYAPIYKKANEAITKVAKAGGYTYVIDLSAGAVIYVDDANAKSISDDVKRELSIPLDKKLPQQQQQPAN